MRGRGPILLAVLLWTIPSLAGDPLPYRLGLEVVQGAEAAAESLREQLEEELLAGVERSGCFVHVGRPAAPSARPDDLLFTVTLDRFEDEIEYDASIAQRNAPDQPPGQSQGYVAHMAADALFTVELADRSAVVRAKRHHLDQRLRPLVPQADAREDVRIQLIEGVVRVARAFLCDGSPRRWKKQLARARAGPRSTPGRPR